MNTVLKAEHDFEIKAKRAIITHDFEKLANSVLSDISIENVSVQYETKKMCQQIIPWKDNNFWNELPNPNAPQKQKSNNDFKTFKLVEALSLPFQKINFQKNSFFSTQTQTKKYSELSRQYFEKWKIFTKKEKDKKNRLNEQIEQKEKLDNFLKNLKKCQNRLKQNKALVMLHCTTENQNFEQPKELLEIQTKLKSSPVSGCYKHRYKAQQNIILMQKEKLIQQEKLIQELQFGKLNEEINQSLQETEKEIQEALSKCSAKVKCKVGSIPLETIPDHSVKFHIDSGKAPKIVLQMEKRALEREQRRQMILERKRLMDQQKREAIEMELKKKQALDEEERKRNLREIKERRQKQMEIQQQMQIRKQKYLENCMKADRFYRRKITRKTFKGFLQLMIIKEKNMVKSQEFYEISLKRKGWKQWSIFILEIEYSKVSKAEELHNMKLKKKTLKLWLNMYIESIQHAQVAEDLYEMKLQSKMFIHWHRYTCMQYVLQAKNLQKAQEHYKKRILLHYFYQWKTLPAVMQLEKAKEEKKRRWREKVWEVLPDYKPVTDG